MGVLVGLLTGLGTNIGWIASQSFVATIETTGAVAGAVYVLLFIVIALLLFFMLAFGWETSPIMGRRCTRRHSALVLLIIRQYNQICALDFWRARAVGLAFFAVFLRNMFRRLRQEHRESQKVCADCAETVKKGSERVPVLRLSHAYARGRVTKPPHQ